MFATLWFGWWGTAPPQAKKKGPKPSKSSTPWATSHHFQKTVVQWDGEPKASFSLDAAVVCCWSWTILLGFALSFLNLYKIMPMIVLRVACCWFWLFCCVVWITPQGKLAEPPHSSKLKEIPLQDCHLGNLCWSIQCCSLWNTMSANATLWTHAAVPTPLRPRF